METHNELEILQRIKRVEAPVDLYDKVLSQLKPNQKVSWSLSIAASIAFFLLAASNIWFVNKNISTQQEYNSSESGYFESILSNSTNHLYNE